MENEKFYNLAASAVLLGLATLTRTVTQYLWVFIVAFLFWRFRKKISARMIWQSVAFVAIILAILSPWLYRNAKIFGAPALAVTKVTNLFGYFVPSILALENNTSYTKSRDKFFQEENVPDITVINLKNARHYEQRSWLKIKQHKVAAVKVIALTTVSFLTHDGYLGVAQDLGYLTDGAPSLPVFKIIQSPKLALQITGKLIKSPGIVVVLGRIFWIITTILAIAGAILAIKNKGWQNGTMLSLTIIAYFILTTAIVGLGVTARYRQPINIFIISFAFYAINRIRIRKNQLSQNKKI